LVRRNYYRNYASYPRLNLGTPICYIGGIDWPVSRALWLGSEPQARFASDAGHVTQLVQSPNSYRAEVSSSAPARLVFNQNYAPGYVSNLGAPVEDHGRLALDLPAGSHRLELRYRPAELLPSAAISCVGLMLLGGLALRRGPRTPRT
jgi:hypothetical protein